MPPLDPKFDECLVAWRLEGRAFGFQRAKNMWVRGLPFCLVDGLVASLVGSTPDCQS